MVTDKQLKNFLKSAPRSDLQRLARDRGLSIEEREKFSQELRVRGPPARTREKPKSFRFFS